MMGYVSRHLVLGCMCATLIIANLAVWFLTFQSSRNTLSVAFLDVGQGDAVFIQSPTGIQVLIDGGKDRSALRELGKVMSPLDRTLDVVIATHPDADHVGGLPGVLERYRVALYLEPGVVADTSPARALAAAVGEEEGVTSLYARRGQRLHLGGGAYLDMLFPDRDVSGLETNTASVVARLSYGATTFLLTGDAPESIEDYVAELDGETLQSAVIKAGHHGSNTSTGPALLAAARPAVAVVSAGKDNTYGHPHPDVVARIEEAGAHVVSTAESGTLTFISDGASIRMR